MVERIAPLTKLIGGKRYILHGGYTKKPSAQAEAAKLRRQGWSIRVVKRTRPVSGWFVYHKDPYKR